MVDDHELVRKIEQEVALIGGSLEPEPDRLELEREVVAEGTVEAQVRLVLVAEERAQRAQERKHRRLPASLLLDEAARGRSNDALERILGG
jgi:hypothetical protein